MSSTQGPFGGTVAAQDAAVGTIDWTDFANLALNSDLEASTALDNGDITKYAKVTGYGFAIPTTATILGITVTIGRRSATDGVADDLVKLCKAGTIGGSSKNVVGNWPALLTRQTYGGAGDLWGNTLAPADVNNAGFGVALAAIGTGGAAEPGFIQRPGITVTYYDPPAVGSDAPSGAGSGVNSVTVG